MKTSLILLAPLMMLCVSLPRPARASEPWTTQDIIFQSAFTALAIIDWRQTLYTASHHDSYSETNLFLSKKPSRGEVNMYFASAIIAHALIANILPHPWRPAWQTAWIGIEINSIQCNYAAGVHMSW